MLKNEKRIGYTELHHCIRGACLASAISQFREEERKNRKGSWRRLNGLCAPWLLMQSFSSASMHTVFHVAFPTELLVSVL